jgi:DNA polymerase-3 subunit epsilon
MRTIPVTLFLLSQIESAIVNCSGYGSKELKRLGKELNDIIEARPKFTASLMPLVELATACGKPLIGFDIEATGTSPEKDRIIELAAVKITPMTGTCPGYTRTDKVWLINPGGPIPAESTKVHGITTADVSGKPNFADIAPEVEAFFAGCDVIGFSSNTFDVLMLSEHLAKSAIKWPGQDVRRFDGATIFRRQHPRTLAAAKEVYTFAEISGAHRALADVNATLEVFAAQLEAEPGLLTDMTPDELHTLCLKSPNQIDLAGKLLRDEQGFCVYNIGKAKGTRLVDDRGFGIWMLRQDFAADTKMHLERELYQGM